MIRHDGARATSAAPPYYGYGVPQDEPVDARALTKIVRRHRLLILGTVVAISGTAALLAFNMTPRYTGVASVTIDGSVAPGTAFDPDDIAEHYWTLHTQPPEQWQREVLFTGTSSSAT